MAAHSGETETGVPIPNETFELLGDETRIQILWALWDTFDPHAEDNTIPFSDLFDRVDINNSGNFSYHLEKLLGHFVEQADDGYELSPAGFTLTQSLLAGTMTEDPTFGPTEVDARCPLCEAPIEVAYENKHLTCYCSACDGTWPSKDDSGYLVQFHFPPGGVQERSPEEIFRATLSRAFRRIETFLDGVCPDCSGPVESSLEVCRDHETDASGRCQNCNRPHMAEAKHVCRRCKWPARGPARAALLVHPSVTAFYHDHGVNHRFASWDAFRRSHHIREELVSEDPLEIRLSIPVDDDELHLTLDDDLHVVDSTWSQLFPHS